MSWKPPDPSDIDALKWLGLAGALAAVVDLLKAMISDSRYTWWQKLVHSLLIGVLSVGLGAMFVDVFPDISFFMLLGAASMSGYLGADWVMGLAMRVWRSGKDGKP